MAIVNKNVFCSGSEPNLLMIYSFDRLIIFIQKRIIAVVDVDVAPGFRCDRKSSYYC